MASELWIRPSCGLCNRWRALLSAVRLAHETNRGLRIFWEKSNDCNTELSTLWRHVATRTGYETAEQLLVTREQWQAQATPHFASDKLHSPRFDPLTVKHLGQTAGSIRISSYFRFGDQLSSTPLGAYDAYLGRSLEIIQRLAEFRASPAARQLWTVANPYRVSVNLRYYGMAHPKSRQVSPPGWFEDQMQAILRKHPRATFLLVVDHRQQERQWLQQFPGSLALPGKCYEHGHPQVSADSLLEVQLMSEGDAVLGAWYSSMSEHPSILNPHVQLYDAKRPWS